MLKSWNWGYDNGSPRPLDGCSTGSNPVPQTIMEYTKFKIIKHNPGEILGALLLYRNVWVGFPNSKPAISIVPGGYKLLENVLEARVIDASPLATTLALDNVDGLTSNSKIWLDISEFIKTNNVDDILTVYWEINQGTLTWNIKNMVV